MQLLQNKMKGRATSASPPGRVLSLKTRTRASGGAAPSWPATRQYRETGPRRVTSRIGPTWVWTSVEVIGDGALVGLRCLYAIAAPVQSISRRLGAPRSAGRPRGARIIRRRRARLCPRLQQLLAVRVPDGSSTREGPHRHLRGLAVEPAVTQIVGHRRGAECRGAELHGRGSAPASKSTPRARRRRVLLRHRYAVAAMAW